MMNRRVFVPHSRPFLGEEEAEVAAGVIRSGHVAQGEHVAALEALFALRYGRAGALAVNSGTAALHLVMAAMGIGNGDEVIIPDYVCSALLNAIRHAGARPVPADIDPHTLTIDTADAAARVTKRTRAIVAVHLFGMPADMDGLMGLGIPVIEDCAQSVGGSYHGRPLGGIGHASAFSFYATKVITSGEGGMALFSSRDESARARDMRDYDNRDDDAVRYNYKMTDIQAAIARIQFRRIDDFIARREKIARRYSAEFSDIDVELPMDVPGRIWFRYVIRLKNESYVESWIQKTGRYGVVCARPVFKPLHRLMGLSGFEKSEDAWNRLVSVPIYPAMKESEIGQVIDAVKMTAKELL